MKISKWKRNVTIAICCFLIVGITSADTWRYEAKRNNKSFTFGKTKIMLTTDGTKNQQYPDFLFKVFHNGKIQAQAHSIYFEKVFASPDQKLFLGLSNQGLPGTAVVLFNMQGGISLLAKHGIAEFDYCEKSVTVTRKWFDEENSNVQFLMQENGFLKTITLRDCHGKIVDLFDTVAKAYTLAQQNKQNQNNISNERKL